MPKCQIEFSHFFPQHIQSVHKYVKFLLWYLKETTYMDWNGYRTSDTVKLFFFCSNVMQKDFTLKLRGLHSQVNLRLTDQQKRKQKKSLNILSSILVARFYKDDDATLSFLKVWLVSSKLGFVDSPSIPTLENHVTDETMFTIKSYL